MTYPENIERKLGFSDIRTLLKGRCMSTLGTEWVDNHVQFSDDFEAVTEALAQVKDFMRFMQTE